MMYAKIGIAIAIILAAYWKGYHDEHKRFLAFQAEVAAIGKAQELANQNAIQLSEVITEGIKDEYETRIASLRRQYANAGRVCDTRSGGSQMPPFPSPPMVLMELPPTQNLLENVPKQQLN
jgi:hypothetical protein